MQTLPGMKKQKTVIAVKRENNYLPLSFFVQIDDKRYPLMCPKVWAAGFTHADPRSFRVFGSSVECSTA